MAKYKFKLKDLSITHHFSSLQVKVFVWSVLGITACFLLLYVPITAYNNHKEKVAVLAERAFQQESSRAIEESPKVADFQFPGNFLSFSANLAPNRPLDHIWERSETHFFWVSTEDLGIASLGQTNHDLLTNYLATVEAKNKGF